MGDNVMLTEEEQTYAINCGVKKSDACDMIPVMISRAMIDSLLEAQITKCQEG